MMISKKVKGQLEKKKILLHSFSLFLFSSCPSHTYTTTKPTQQPITTTLDSKNKKKNHEKNVNKHNNNNTVLSNKISEIFAATLE